MENLKREFGFLKIKNYESIDMWRHKEDGVNCLCKIKMNAKNYIYKYGSEEDCYREMFWGFVLNYLNLANVQYDLVRFQGHYGVITENCNIENRPFKSLKKILLNYCFNHCLGRESRYSDYHLKFIDSAYEWTFQDNYTDSQINNLKEETFLQFLIQLLLGNNDLNAGNISIFLDDLTLFPFYDFGGYGKANMGKFENQEFLLDYTSGTILKYPVAVFKNFWSHASKKEKILYLHYLYAILNLKPKEIFEEMETKIDYNLNKSLKRKFEKELKRNALRSEKLIDKMESGR